MSTFAEAEHPRHVTGRFAEKNNTAPTGVLDFDDIQKQMTALHLQQVEAAMPEMAEIIARLHPEATGVRLYEDSDGMTSWLCVEGVVDEAGVLIDVDLDAEDEDRLNELIRDGIGGGEDVAVLSNARAVHSGHSLAHDDRLILTLPTAATAEPESGRTADERTFYAAITDGRYDNDLAAAALRGAASRVCPGATALRYEGNYDEDGMALFLTGVDGWGGDTEDVEDELNIPFMMSGKGNTGAEITGMRDDGNDYFTFPLGATS